MRGCFFWSRRQSLRGISACRGSNIRRRDLLAFRFHLRVVMRCDAIFGAGLQLLRGFRRSGGFDLALFGCRLLRIR